MKSPSRYMVAAALAGTGLVGSVGLAAAQSTDSTEDPATAESDTTTDDGTSSADDAEDSAEGTTPVPDTTEEPAVDDSSL